MANSGWLVHAACKKLREDKNSNREAPAELLLIEVAIVMNSQGELTGRVRHCTARVLHVATGAGHGVAGGHAETGQGQSRSKDEGV